MLAAMAESAAIRRMSAGEYLAWERTQPDKHEFHGGEVFAMAGGSPRHNFLGAAAIVQLSAALRDRKCVVLSSDQRIATAPGERFVYADAVCVCGGFESDPAAADVLVNPAIIVEVISPTTERYDRGEKWEAYQRIPSVTDYLLVAQGSARIEHYRREGDGWKYRLVESGGTIELTNGASLTVDAIYLGAFDLPAA